MTATRFLLTATWFLLTATLTRWLIGSIVNLPLRIHAH